MWMILAIVLYPVSEFCDECLWKESTIHYVIEFRNSTDFQLEKFLLFHLYTLLTVLHCMAGEHAAEDSTRSSSTSATTASEAKESNFRKRSSLCLGTPCPLEAYPASNLEVQTSVQWTARSLFFSFDQFFSQFRRIQVPGNITLSNLHHHVLCPVIGWSR